MSTIKEFNLIDGTFSGEDATEILGNFFLLK